MAYVHVRDEDPEIHKAYMEGMRAMTYSQRAEFGMELTDLWRRMMRTGIKTRFPHYTDRQARLALCRIMYGEEFFREHLPNEEIEIQVTCWRESLTTSGGAKLTWR